MAHSLVLLGQTSLWLLCTYLHSNNWVVGPNRTATGKPLLCNDPHLQLLAPSLWLVMHLKSPTLEAIGATLAGVPGVVLGRNQYIAWGVTNVGADVQVRRFLLTGCARSTIHSRVSPIAGSVHYGGEAEQPAAVHVQRAVDQLHAL